MSIIGHNKVINFLDRCIAKDNLAQAYIFSGQEGVGKFLAAEYFARKINKEEEKAIEENLVFLSAEIEEIKGVIKKRDIKIESVREMQRKLNVTVSAGKKKIAIISDADRLTRSAQNSLLKTLEEPPENSIIILIVEEAKKLLPTIFSRCQNIRFNLLNDEEIGQIVPLDWINREEIIFWSYGRPGWTIRFLQDGKELQEKKEILKQLNGLLSADINEKFAYAEEASKNLPKLLEALDFWVALLGGVFSDGRRLVNASNEKALSLIGEIEKRKQILKETNSNARLILEELLLNF